MWSGSVASIPTGYVLCNGSNGTPDLRGRFVIGAGGAYTPDDTGGTSTHTHTVSGTTGANSASTSVNGAPASTSVASHPHTHSLSTTSGSAGTLPPYYALCYIMKT